MNIYAFWKAVLGQEAEKIRPYFHPDACIRWHCTNECFSVEDFLVANCEYPGHWDGQVERLEQVGDLYISVTRVFPKDHTASFHVTSFARVREGQILSLDEYWADDGEAPAWRRAKGIGGAIR